MNRPYRVGEMVLMNWHGWLKAFTVVKVDSHMEGDVEHVEYTMSMLDKDAHLYQWQKPARE